MSLPFFREFGWQPYVLTVEPTFVEGLADPMLEASLPLGTQIFRTRALPLRLSRALGFGNLGLRSLPFLGKKGDEVIKEHGIDLAYFSTTVFPSMSLGVRWRRKWGMPYVLDFQDPWLNSYYNTLGSPPPPGGKFKYGISQAIARFLEPRAARHASHIISVSPAYPRMLMKRYKFLTPDMFTALPFGAAASDFEEVINKNVKQSAFDRNDGLRHWVYVGRAGDNMAKALHAFFKAIRKARDRDPVPFNSLRFHFIGTDYAPIERAFKTVQPIADESGLFDLVEESTNRVPYFEALKILTDSDGILLFGSDDPGYTASKLYPCILAKKPIFAIFHEDSSVVEILRRCNSGRAVTFASDEDGESISGRAVDAINWLLSLSKGITPETNWDEFEQFTAREMTRKQCAIFDECVIQHGGSQR